MTGGQRTRIHNDTPSSEQAWIKTSGHCSRAESRPPRQLGPPWSSKNVCARGSLKIMPQNRYLAPPLKNSINRRDDLGSLRSGARVTGIIIRPVVFEPVGSRVHFPSRFVFTPANFGMCNCTIACSRFLRFSRINARGFPTLVVIVQCCLVSGTS